MAEGGTRPTHILIVGKTRSGKSATGNSILMENLFQSSSGGDSVTLKSEAAGNEVMNRQVIVVDTPGTGNTIDQNKVFNDIANSVCQLDNLIDVFIIVMEVTPRITEEEMISWKQLKNLLGQDFLKHAIIVFTGGDDYERQMRRKKDQRDFDTFLRETSGAKLLQILDDCGWRYVLFNNFADSDWKTVQVFELFEKIDELKRENDGQMYRTKYPARYRTFDENNFEIANLYDPDLGDSNLTFESMKEEMKNCKKEPGDEKASGGKELNILLVGNTGHGKSATANTILQDEVFATEGGGHGESVTTECGMFGVNFEGRHVNVVDTPGTMDTRHPDDAYHHLATALGYLKGTIDAVVLVLNYKTRMTEEERNTIEKVKQFFRSEVMSFMAVIFTHGDNFKEEQNRNEDEKTFADFLKDNGGQYLNGFLAACGNRYVLFDNYAKGKDAKKQIRELVSVIDKMAKANKGKRYQSNFLDVESHVGYDDISNGDNDSIYTIHSKIVCSTLDT